MKKKLAVEKNPDDVIPFEIMERSIVTIGESISRINKTRVTRKMVVALIQDDCKVGKGIIETVLDSFEQLEQNYLKKKSK